MKRVRFNIQEEVEEDDKFDSSSSEDGDDEIGEEDEDREEEENRAGHEEDQAVRLVRRRLQDGELDVRGRILYQKLLGTKLLRRVLDEGRGGLNVGAEEEAVALLTPAYDLAQQELQPTDELRLACCQAACFALCAVCNDHLQAKVMAEDCFNATHPKAHKLTDAAIAILEQIRKHFMMRDVGANLQTPDAQHKQWTARKPRVASLSSNATSSSSAQGGATSLSHAASAPAILDPLAFSNGLSPALNLPGIRRAIRAGSGLPVQLDTLPEAPQLLSAMDQIFRLYVRGFALPGQQHDGSSVNLVGQKLAFGAFLLDGPYMSWDGFLRFSFDFRIAKLSPAVLHTFGHRVCACENVTALLTYAQLAVVFTEASGSDFPVLVARKFSERYRKLEEMPDLWEDIARTFQHSASTPAPTTGLNFLQFMDCIAKCALVGYSSDEFRHILPSAEDKVKHLITAHLSLSDRNRWLPRIAFQEKSRLREQFKGAPMRTPIAKASPPPK